MTVQRELERQARSMGARFFGVADLTVAQEAIVAQGGEFLATYPRALSVGIALSDGIVDQLPRHKEVAVACTYDRLYDTVNWSLDRIALRLSVTLNEHGFGTLLIPASDTLDKGNLLSGISPPPAGRGDRGKDLRDVCLCLSLRSKGSHGLMELVLTLLAMATSAGGYIISACHVNVVVGAALGIWLLKER
jgi:hypothetical protein